MTFEAYLGSFLGGLAIVTFVVCAGLLMSWMFYLASTNNILRRRNERLRWKVIKYKHRCGSIHDRITGLLDSLEDTTGEVFPEV